MKFAIQAIFIILYVNFLSPARTFAQTTFSLTPQTELAIAYRMSHLSLIDELISQQQYSGRLMGGEVNWIMTNERRISQLGIGYVKGSRIKNFTVPAEVQQILFYFHWLNKITDLRLFAKTGNIFIGPSLQAFFHHRQQDIGNTPLESSDLGVASLNFYSCIHLGLTNTILFIGDLQVAVLAIAGKTDRSLPGEKRSRRVKLLTGFSATHIGSKVAVHWKVHSNLAFQLAYLFNLRRITPWDYFRSLSDHLSVQVGINF